MSKETEIRKIEHDIAEMESSLLSAKASIKRLREGDGYDIGIDCDYFCPGTSPPQSINHGDTLAVFQGRSGNVFKTKGEAQLFYKWQVIDTKIRKFAQDYNAGWVPDYSNPNEDKLSLTYDPTAGSIQWSTSYFCHDNRLKFKDRRSLDKLIKLVSEEEIKFWLTYIKPIYTLELELKT